jgi:hypothetical protein
MDPESFLSFCLDNCFRNEATVSSIRASKKLGNIDLNKYCAKLQIKNREIVIKDLGSKVVHSRLNYFFDFLSNALKQFNLDLDFFFILNTADEDQDFGTTAFCFSRGTSDSKNVLFPDPHSLNYYFSNPPIRDISFSYKINGCVFRGSDTGSFPDARSNIRIKTCDNFHNSNFYDFKISNFVSYDEKILAEQGFEISKIRGDYLSNQDQSRYKYIADMDGNTISWDRNYWALPINSILVKYADSQKQKYETWYSKYIYDNGIVPVLTAEYDLENNPIDQKILQKQKDFSKILMDKNILFSYVKNFLYAYNSIFNS